MHGMKAFGAHPERKRFKDGGPVRGPGTGTSDDVKDVVPDGSYIMPADSTAAIGEQALSVIGTGNVPVNLSNGEFKLPPEQVHAVGVQALDQMKGATHAPAPQQGGLGMKPELFFADGGVVEEEKRNRATSPTNIYPGSQLPGNSGATSAPAPPTVPSPAPAPAASQTAAPSPSNIFPGNRLQAESGRSGAPAPVAPAPPPLPANSPSRAAGMSSVVNVPAPAPGYAGMTDAQRAMALSQIPTDTMQAPKPAPPAASTLGQQAQSDRDAFGAAWDTIKDVNNDAGRAIADVAMLVPRGLAGAYDSAVVRPMRAAGMNASFLSPSLVPDGVDPASMTPYTDQKRMQPAQAGAAAATAGAPSAPAVTPAQAPGTAGIGPLMGPPDLSQLNALAQSGQAAAAAPAATQVAPGVYQHGRGQYSDQVSGMSFSPNFTGQPNAQNLAAAGALAQRSQQESIARAGARGMGAVAGDGPGWSGVIGTDPGAGRERRELVSSFMTPLKGAQNGQLTAAQRTGMLSLLNQESQAQQASERNDTAIQQSQIQAGNQRDIAAMRESGDNGRALMRELGESGRAGSRNALDSRRVDLEEKVRGTEMRAAERQEKLYQKYEKAETPEERAAIAQQMRDLQGKPQESPWKVHVTPAVKNLDGSTSEGSVIRQNTQTGEVERVDLGARPGGGQALAVGSTSTVNGKTAVWDGSKWVPR